MGVRFRLMTANLLLDRCDPAHVAEVLDRHRPEVVVIQELGPMAAEVIADRYPHHELHPALDYVGRGIASRLPAGFGTIPLPRRPATWARLEVGDRPTYLAGVHLLNPINFPWVPAARGRGRQISALLEWFDRSVGDSPIVVAGDLNATPSWPAYRRLTETFTDLVAEQARADGMEPEPTWGWRPGWPRLLRIDHVLGRGVAAVGAEVVPVRGTDHAALVVDLEVEPGQQGGIVGKPA